MRVIDDEIRPKPMIMISWWLVSATLGLLIIVWIRLPQLIFNYIRELRAAKRVTGHQWSTHWFFGDLFQMAPTERYLLSMQKNVQEKRSKMVNIWLGPIYVYFALHHPSVIKKVMKTPKNMVVYDLLRPWIGEGLLISKDRKWSRNRHLLTPAFHYEILKPYMSVYNNCLKVMFEKWDKFAARGEPVKVFETVGMLSLDVVLQCAFSYQSNCQIEGEGHQYVKAVYKISKLVVDRSLSFLSYLDFIYWLTPNGQEMAKYCRIVHDHSEQVIRNRKIALGLLDDNADHELALQTAKKQRKYLDFLDILLTARDTEGIGLTDLEIRDEADTFMFEGHDTTTSGMSWALYCLAQHPKHQDKVREEVKNVLQGREWLEYEDLKELKYTQWCIKEAMRLYPPVIEIYRRLTEDTKLDGVTIPKGSKISISINNLHHNPDVWENPDEYNPLRFHPSNAEGRDPFAYMPFSAGYRNCIGQNFALNEEKVVIAMLCHRFKFSLLPSHKVELLPTINLRTKNDILLQIERII